MCGVVGAFLRNPSAEDMMLLKRVISESRIRGLHATGVSFVRKNTIFTIKAPLPADEFLAGIDMYSMLNEDGNLYMVAHCRYSTSDLEFNQPLFTDKVAIVHNGVITQELPENWSKISTYATETRNDSELLLKTVENGENPLERWPDASISACEVHSDKIFRFYRNGKRPLTQYRTENGVIVASTHDIFNRAGVEKTIDCGMNVVYTVSDGEIAETVVKTNNKDLQYGKYEI